MDLSKLSDADLAAVAAGDMSKVSEAGLRHLTNASTARTALIQPGTGSVVLDSASAVGSGYSQGLVRLAGLPVDTAANVLDLGKAAAGLPWVMAGKLPPDALQVGNRADVVGSGDNLMRVLTGTKLGKGAVTAANPEYEGGYLQAAGSGAAGAVSLSQAALGIMSAVAGKGVGEYTGNQAASITASLLAPGVARAVVRRPVEGRTLTDTVLQKAQAEGYVVPPSHAGAGWLNNRLESVAGKAALTQDANQRNQVITDKLAARALNLKPGELTPRALAALRADAYAEGYQPIADMPRVARSKSYVNDLNAIDTQYGRPLSPVSTLRNPEVTRTIMDLKAARKMTGEEALKLIKDLREQGRSKIESSYGSAGGSGARDLGKAMVKSTGALENLITENLMAAGPSNVVPRLQQARKDIAKTYSVEDAMNPATGNISVGPLARAFQKNKPLEGDLLTIGEFGTAFPMFSRPVNQVGTPGVSALEAFAVPAFAAAGQASTGNAAGALAGGVPLLRSPVRNLLLSSAYQKLFAHRKGLRSPALTPEELGALSASLAAQGQLTPQ